MINKVLKKDNRIEFRLPNGTLSMEIWQNYVNFFSRLVLISKTDIDKEKLLYELKNLKKGLIILSDLIFDNDLDKDEFLIQTLKYNKCYKKKLHKHIDGGNEHLIWI